MRPPSRAEEAASERFVSPYELLETVYTPQGVQQETAASPSVSLVPHKEAATQQTRALEMKASEGKQETTAAIATNQQTQEQQKHTGDKGAAAASVAASAAAAPLQQEGDACSSPSCSNKSLINEGGKQ